MDWQAWNSCQFKWATIFLKKKNWPRIYDLPVHFSISLCLSVLSALLTFQWGKFLQLSIFGDVEARRILSLVFLNVRRASKFQFWYLCWGWMLCCVILRLRFFLCLSKRKFINNHINIFFKKSAAINLTTKHCCNSKYLTWLYEWSPCFHITMSNMAARLGTDTSQNN